MSIGQKISCNLYCRWEIKSNPIKVEPILLHIFSDYQENWSKIFWVNMMKFEKVYWYLNHLSANPTKWLNRLKTVRREIADELFECVWPFYVVGA